MEIIHRRCAGICVHKKRVTAGFGPGRRSRRRQGRRSGAGSRTKARRIDTARDANEDGDGGTCGQVPLLLQTVGKQVAASIMAALK